MALFLKCMVSPVTGTVLLPLGGSQGQQEQAVNFESLLDNLDQQLRRRRLMSGTGVSVRWSLTLGGSVVSTAKKSSFEPYMYVYTQSYVCYRVCPFLFLDM